ncbi:hypothetical protein D9757_012277 [Collybiopsis confluens]|uniref:Uncharacterized protein n=1 Tax=Collybiopsis confluens TaxID=2823264 RepID=A0A8H5GPE7_9AGAR|nr:hypothetical protein D9757_012277 [Collybiopsis confluens]
MSTLILSILSFAPYVPIIISDRQHSPGTVWLYTLLRIVGPAAWHHRIPIDHSDGVRQIIRHLRWVIQDDWLFLTHRYPIFLRTAQIVLLVLGVASTGVSYIGCFTLVQQTKTLNTFLWLGLETFLSILRVVIWVWNPSWDEVTGIRAIVLFGSGQRELISALTSARGDVQRDIFMPRDDSFLQTMCVYRGSRPGTDALPDHFRPEVNGSLQVCSRTFYYAIHGHPLRPAF